MKKWMLVFSILIASSTNAAEWYQISVPSGTSDVFLEASSISRSGKIVRSWVAFVVTDGVYTGSSSKTLFGFDCQKMESAMLRVATYNPDESLATQGNLNQDFSPPTPDSAEFEIMTALCTSKSKDAIIKKLHGFKVEHPLESTRKEKLRRAIEAASDREVK